MAVRGDVNRYELVLDENPANHAPLTPLSFIGRTAHAYPGELAVVHGARRLTWAETYARSRRLASALARWGIGVGHTVTGKLQKFILREQVKSAAAIE